MLLASEGWHWGFGILILIIQLVIVYTIQYQVREFVILDK